MSPATDLVVRSSPNIVYGLIRRCRVHKAREGCECSQPDCLVELLPMEQPVASYWTGSDRA